MRIDPIALSTYAKPPTPPQPPKPETGGPNAPRDTVEFSAAASALLHAQQANAGERVAAIRDAVQSGLYQVDTRTLALKILPHL